MIEAVLLGALLGSLAGLFPGFHTNLIAALIAGAGFDAWSSSVFLISVAAARAMTDSLPSVFLGASDNVLALLPAHRLMKRGQGGEAVELLIFGGLLGILGVCVLSPFLLAGLPALYAFVKPYVFWILFAFTAYLIVKEQSVWAFIVFVLAGTLGLLALKSVADPFFPMLSGFFGASGLMISLVEAGSLPVQSESARARFQPKKCAGALAVALAAALLVTMVPGLGPSQGLALVQRRREGPRKYLLMTGAIVSIDVVLSLVTYAILARARNGAVVTISHLVGSLSFDALVSLIAACFLSAGLAACSALLMKRKYARVVGCIDSRLLSAIILLILAAFSFFLSGGLGVLIFVVACAIGLIAPLSGVSRSLAMACLILPTLIALW